MEAEGKGLKIALLGRPSVWLDGQKIDGFVSNKALALLCFMVTEKGGHARQTLAGLLWGGLPEQRALASLRTVLYNLRQLLPGYWDISQSTAAFLAGLPFWSDLYEFEQTLAENVTAMSFDSLKTATDLYQGDYLDGIYVDDAPAFESWLLQRRENLRIGFLNALEKLAEHDLQQRDWEKGIEHVQRILEIEPYRESAHRTMMLLLARTGQLNRSLAHYESYRKFIVQDLDVEPEQETWQLYESVKSASNIRTHNLPPQPSPIVGREEEIAALHRELAGPDCRLLTITGVGGIGKSRLADQVARSMNSTRLRMFLHGIVYVPLVGIDPGDLTTAIGDGLAIVYSGLETAEEQLLYYLQNKELLLLLDNYEHLLPDTRLLARILEEAPEVKLLVTSRERLNLREEWVFELDGLPYPGPDAVIHELFEFGSYPSLQLFANCAGRIQRSFSLTRSIQEVAEICQMVQGMPLALELSAARLNSLTPADVLLELGRSLDILATEAGNALPRHASLRAVFDASWAGLSDKEQEVLRRLSLFRGGFTRQAAAEVAGATLPVLIALANKSLVCLLPTGRYEMHELLRQYAAEKLAAEPVFADLARQSYATYYGDFLRTREQRLLETHQEETLREIDLELANIRQAWRWLVEYEQTGILCSALWTLASFYLLRGSSIEGLMLVEGVLSRLGWLDEQELQQARLRLRLHLFQAFFLYWLGRLREARTILEQDLPELRRFCTPQDVSMALFTLGNVLAELGVPTGTTYQREALVIARSSRVLWLEGVGATRLAEFLFKETSVTAREECEQLLRQAFAIAEKLDNPFVLENVYLVDGRLADAEGESLRAEQSYERAVAACRRIENMWVMGFMLMDLGSIKYRQGSLVQAQQYYEESLICSRRTGARKIEAFVLNCMGELARCEGKLVLAVKHYQDSLGICQELSLGINICWVSCNLGHALLRQSAVERAASCFRVSLSGWSDNNNLALVGMCLAGVGGVLLARGQPQQAAQLAGATQAQFDAVPRPLEPADRQDWERIRAQVQGQLDEASFTIAWAAGQALSTDEAIALALSTA